jgi:hypothetical protein
MEVDDIIIYHDVVTAETGERAACPPACGRSRVLVSARRRNELYSNRGAILPYHKPLTMH